MNVGTICVVDVVLLTSYVTVVYHIYSPSTKDSSAASTIVVSLSPISVLR